MVFLKKYFKLCMIYTYVYLCFLWVSELYINVFFFEIKKKCIYLKSYNFCFFSLNFSIVRLRKIKDFECYLKG